MQGAVLGPVEQNEYASRILDSSDKFPTNAKAEIRRRGNNQSRKSGRLRKSDLDDREVESNISSSFRASMGRFPEPPSSQPRTKEGTVNEDNGVM